MDLTILLYVLVGFLAQMIDGALGMAYGVSSNSFLLSIGVPPAIASASVHTAEVFTTAISGLSHLKLGNVDKKLFVKLLIPGILGGASGAYILSLEVVGNVIKPFVAAYLLVMGIVIFWKTLRKAPEREVTRFLIPLGLIGGFFDAVGGGGWGPIVTTTVVARGHNPRFTIGSVNSAEFFVTFAEAATFIITIPHLISQYWQIILGLLVGGIIAAPLAAYACKRLPARLLLNMVSILIIALSVRTIVLSLL